MADVEKVELTKADHDELLAKAARAEKAEADLAAARAAAPAADATPPPAGRVYEEGDVVEVVTESGGAHPPVPKAWLGTPLAAGLKRKPKGS